MALTLILEGLVGAGLAGVAVYFWPQLMGWAREQLVPWVDRNIPELADSVRLAFQDLDKVAVGLQRAVRTAWRKLRGVLLSQTAQFVRLVNGAWAVRITSCLRNPRDSGEPVVRLITEQELDWADVPEEIRAAAMSNGIDGTSIDLVQARDQLLAETA